MRNGTLKCPRNAFADIPYIQTFSCSIIQWYFIINSKSILNPNRKKSGLWNIIPELGLNRSIVLAVLS